MSRREGTRLVQRPCKSLGRCHEEFGIKSDKFETRLVLLPSRSIFSWWMAVPEGMFCMLYKQGRFIKVLEPGYHLYSPLYKVQYVVTKQHAVFDVPVKSCPTRDNINVDIDVMLVFHITDGWTFILNLGPEKLDETLRSIQEECVRTLARSVTYRNVYTLSGRSSEEMVQQMNSKVSAFGVAITSVTITSIRLPNEMSASLENATTFDKKKAEADMRQLYDLRKVEDQQEFDRMKEEYEYTRLTSEKNNEKERTEIKKEMDQLLADHSNQIQALRSDMMVEVNKIDVDTRKKVAELNATRDKEVQEIQARTSAEVDEIKSDMRAQVYKLGSAASSEVAQNTAKAMEVRADAESYAKDKVRVKREFRIKQLKLEVLDSIAKNPQKLVSSKGGMVSTSMATTPANMGMQSQMVEYAMSSMYGTVKK